MSLELAAYREADTVKDVLVRAPALLKHSIKSAEGKPKRSATTQVRAGSVPVVSVSGWMMRNQPLMDWTLAHGPLKATWYAPVKSKWVFTGSMNEPTRVVAIVPSELIAAVQRKRPALTASLPTTAFCGTGPLGPLGG
jgi:hypothetical protein